MNALSLTVFCIVLFIKLTHIQGQEPTYSKFKGSLPDITFSTSGIYTLEDLTRAQLTPRTLPAWRPQRFTRSIDHNGHLHSRTGKCFGLLNEKPKPLGHDDTDTITNIDPRTEKPSLFYTIFRSLLPSPQSEPVIQPYPYEFFVQH